MYRSIKVRGEHTLCCPMEANIISALTIHAMELELLAAVDGAGGSQG